MDESNRTKIFNIIFSLLFLGVILSFSLFFSMTSIMHPNDNLSDGYLNGSVGLSEEDFYGYDNACLKNKMFHSVIVEAEYRLFGNIRRDGAVRGKRGFLFDAGQNEMGYDYIYDYVGGYTLTQEELERFYDIVTTRSKVYENQGRYYILAVIPNSQTVYSENMPTYFGDISQNTVLSQITEYMSTRGVSCYLDLSQPVIDSKKIGVLYNNTENSINALGAYYVYRSIMSGIPEDILSKVKTLDKSEFDYYTHYTDGKSTAVAVGLEALIKNETVSMSNSTEFKYTVVNYTGSYETTYVKSAFREDVPLNPYVLLECSDEWDKIQLMPYFSNTFGVASYKVGHSYDAEVIAQTNPLLVIQTIHEDELSALLDGTVGEKYAEALSESAKPYMTGTPTRVEYSILDDNSVCITGMIDKDAEIQVFGDGFEPIASRSIDGMFFVKIVFEGSAQGREVFLNAKAPDKAASTLLTLSISGQNNVGSAREVLVGNNSMLYSTDYITGYEQPSEDKIRSFEYGIYDLFSEYTKANKNKAAKIIFSSVPRKLSVYSKGLPYQLSSQLARLDENKNTFGSIMSNAGAKYIDLAVPMRGMADDNKMFAQTDDSLTDIAYYSMYREIIKTISQWDAKMSPIKADSFYEYTVPFSSGILASSLGFEYNSVVENLTKLKLTLNKNYYYNSDGSFISYGSNGALPKAVIVYDELSEPMIDMLTKNFSVAYVMKKGDVDISDEVLSSIKPDYIIFLCDEGNIDFEIRNYAK